MPDGRWLLGLLMVLLLLRRWRGDLAGAAQQPATRGRPVLPGLAAAAKEQHAHHGTLMVADAAAGREPNPPSRTRPSPCSRPPLPTANGERSALRSLLTDWLACL